MADQLAKRQGERLEKCDSKFARSTEMEIMKVAREIWYRGGNSKVKAASSEDRDFREFFGCGLSVASEVWDMLKKEDVLPQDGLTCHLLWALMFMKIYGKEKNLCTLAGGVDKKTFRKWAWLFVIAIANLESSVVSNYLFFSLSLQFLHSYFIDFLERT